MENATIIGRVQDFASSFLMMLNLYSFIRPCPETTKAKVYLILKHRIQEGLYMFEKVDIHSLNFNPFDKVGKDWLLISAIKNGKTNTMTASWGTLGHLWNKNVAIIFIRPQRYTKEFVDESETFTLSFFDDKHKELSYLGTKSGKDEDKISNVNFHIEMVDGNPTFKEAKEVFICKKLYVGKLEKEHFLLPEIYEKNYPLDDLHYVYIGEITDVYSNK